MNWFGPDSVDCGCCGVACTDCVAWAATTLTVTGPVHPDCPTGCGDFLGTWVFRSVGDPIPGSCSWARNLSLYNCQLDTPGDDYYLGINCVTTKACAVSVEIATSGSNYKSIVTFAGEYWYVPSGLSTGRVASSWLTKYSRTSSTCSGLLGLHTLESNTAVTSCNGGVINYCATESLGVTIG